MADGARKLVANFRYSKGPSTRHTGPSTLFRYLYQPVTTGWEPNKCTGRKKSYSLPCVVHPAPTAVRFTGRFMPCNGLRPVYRSEALLASVYVAGCCLYARFFPHEYGRSLVDGRIYERPLFRFRQGTPVCPASDARFRGNAFPPWRSEKQYCRDSGA